jgi:hypothetical protein
MTAVSLVSSDRRHHRRVSHLASVQVHTPYGEYLLLDVIDYSTGGLCLVSRESYDIGAILQFDYLLGADGHQRRLDLAGQVCYVQEQFQEYGLGIKFL